MLMDSLRDLTGCSAAVIGTVLMLPQVWRSWRTRQVDDLALGMVLLYVLNCSLWLVYGLMIRAKPVVLCNGAAFLISVLQLSLKVRYGGRPPS